MFHDARYIHSHIHDNHKKGHFTETTAKIGVKSHLLTNTRKIFQNVTGYSALRKELVFLARSLIGSVGSKVLNWKHYFDPLYPFGITCFGKASASDHKKSHPGGVKDSDD